MQRKFILGSEWLYYKIYTGVVTSDLVMSEYLHPVIKRLLNDNIISKWFFIRYKDDDIHLRIRVKLKNINHLSFVILEFKNALKPLLDNNLVYNICTDTYNRELERYGADAFKQTEQLFYISSEIVIWKLKNIDNEDRWLYTIKIIDELLNMFDYSLMEKKELLNLMNNSFSKEFGANKYKRKTLSNKYREKHNLINYIIKDKDNQFYDILEWFKNSSSVPLVDIKKTLENKSEDKNNYLFSLIHMHCNRSFRSKQRLSEWVVYNLLFQYYRSELAKNKLAIDRGESRKSLK